MSLKIQPEHYRKLEQACLAVLADRPTAYAEYQAAGLSNMRFNWDVLNASTIDGQRGITWCCDNLYSYLDDSHIGSALARIMGNDGMNGKGKR